MSVCAMPQEASCIVATTQTMSESVAGRSPCRTSNMDPALMSALPVRQSIQQTTACARSGVQHALTQLRMEQSGQPSTLNSTVQDPAACSKQATISLCNPVNNSSSFDQGVVTIQCTNTSPLQTSSEAPDELVHDPQPAGTKAAEAHGRSMHFEIRHMHSQETGNVESRQPGQQEQPPALQERQQPEQQQQEHSGVPPASKCQSMPAASTANVVVTVQQQNDSLQPLQHEKGMQRQGASQQQTAQTAAQLSLGVPMLLQDTGNPPDAAALSGVSKAAGTTATQGLQSTRGRVSATSPAGSKAAQLPAGQAVAAIASKCVQRLGGLKASGIGVSSSSGRLGSIGRSGRLGSLSSPGSSNGGVFANGTGGGLGSSSSSTKRLGSTAANGTRGGKLTLPRGDSRVAKTSVGMEGRLAPTSGGAGFVYGCSATVQSMPAAQAAAQASAIACTVAKPGGDAGSECARVALQQPTLAELSQLAAQARAVSPGLPAVHQQHPAAAGRISRSPSPQLPSETDAADKQPQQPTATAARLPSRSPSPVPAAAAALQSAFSKIRCWSPALKPSHNSLKNRSSSPAVEQGTDESANSQQQTQDSSKQSPAPHTPAVVGQKRVRFSEHLQVFYLPPESRESNKRRSSGSSKGSKKARIDLDEQWQGGAAAEGLPEAEGQQQDAAALQTAVDLDHAQQHQGHRVAASYAPELSWRKARKYKRLAQAAAEGDEVPDEVMAAAATAIAMTAAGRQIIQQQQSSRPADAGTSQPASAAEMTDNNMESGNPAKPAKGRSRKGKRRPRHVNPAVAAAAAAVDAAEGDALISCYKTDDVWSPWHQHVAPPQPLAKGSKEAAALEKMMREEGLDPQTTAAVMTWLYKEKKAPEVEIVRHRVQRFKAVVAPYRRPSMLQWLRKCPRLLNNAEATLSTAVAQLLALFSPSLMLPAQAAELLDRCPQLAARTAAVTKTKVDLFCELLGGCQVAPLLLRFPVMLTMSTERIREVINLVNQILTDNNDFSKLLVAKVKESMAATADRFGAQASTAAVAAGNEAVQQECQPAAATDSEQYVEQQQDQQFASPLAALPAADIPAVHAAPHGTVVSVQQNDTVAADHASDSQQSQQQSQECLAQQQQQQQPQEQQQQQSMIAQSQQQLEENTAQQQQEDQQQCRAPLDLLIHLLILYPAFFIHNPVKVAHHYKRYQQLSASWDLVSSVTGLLGPMMLGDWHFDLFEARVQYLEQHGLLASVREPNSKSCQVSIMNLNSSLFAEKFPGFAAWRLKEKGVPVQQTLTELVSSKSNYKKRKRQQKAAAAAAAQQQAAEGPGSTKNGSSGKKRAAAAAASKKRKQQRLDPADDGEETDEEDLCDWDSGAGSDDEYFDQDISAYPASAGNEEYGVTRDGVLGDRRDITDEGATHEGFMHQNQSGEIVQNLAVSNGTSAAASTDMSGIDMKQSSGSKRRQQPERGKSRQKQQKELEQLQEMMLQQIEQEDSMMYELLTDQQQHLEQPEQPLQHDVHQEVTTAATASVAVSFDPALAM